MYLTRWSYWVAFWKIDLFSLHQDYQFSESCVFLKLSNKAKLFQDKILSSILVNKDQGECVTFGFIYGSIAFIQFL